MKMARDVLEPPVKDKTTIQVSSFLLYRLGVHLKKQRESQTDFLTRAIVNQMEREGDLDIRREMEEQNNG